MCLLSYNVKVNEVVDMFMDSAHRAVSLLHEDPENSKEAIRACKTGFVCIAQYPTSVLLSFVQLFVGLLTSYVRA